MDKNLVGPEKIKECLQARELAPEYVLFSLPGKNVGVGSSDSYPPYLDGKGRKPFPVLGVLAIVAALLAFNLTIVLIQVMAPP